MMLKIGQTSRNIVTKFIGFPARGFCLTFHAGEPFCLRQQNDTAGKDWLGLARHGRARQARQGGARRGAAGPGSARQGRQGWAGHGPAGQCKAGMEL